MKHEMVIGGTGMLREACIGIAKAGCHLSVVARDHEKMDQLESLLLEESSLNKVFVDYHKTQNFIHSMEEAMKEHGPVSLVICWIHSTAPNATQAVIDTLSKTSVPFSLFHIIGSGREPAEVKASLHIPKSMKYQIVQLGWVMEKYHTRWLTHKEISEGVLRAVACEDEYCYVGDIGH